MSSGSVKPLLERAKEYDPDALAEVYDQYAPRIYNYIYYRVGNQHDAEDLTARTFYRALDHIGRYVNRGAPFSAWLQCTAYGSSGQSESYPLLGISQLRPIRCVFQA